jgi:hypothetical protein
VSAPARDAYQYALLRVVPRVERGECLNAGVVLFCRTRSFLAAEVALDRARLAALAPGTDPEPIERHLGALARVAAGDPVAGPIAALPQSDRFGWIAAPSSTVVQPSAIHTGLCGDPADRLAHLMATLVTA